MRQSLDSITKFLESEYPEYYRLKYDVGVTSLNKAQSILPDTESAMVEYFVGDSSIYIFVIEKNDYQLIEVEKDFPLEEWIERLVKRIQKPGQPGRHQMRKDTIADIAFKLYKKIFAPIEEQCDLPPKLILIPDGPLSYLSFDVLLKEKPTPNDHFPQFDFLIKNYQISYCFSATLLWEMQERKNAKTSNKFLAFAPEFKLRKVIADSLIAQLPFEEQYRNATRSNLRPLANNIPEVKQLGEMVGGNFFSSNKKIFIGSDATLENFLENCSNYKVLHLSSHAQANDKVGDYSWIAFYQKDSVDNEFLYNRDLYNLDLNADMVVLSACETGGGELQRGEGVIGLTRGFSYAGAKSLVTSLWQVNDRSTKELMQDFYKSLKEGKTKDAALREAKLTQFRNNEYADPFYWAAFIPIGDMEPIDLNTKPYWKMGMGLGIIIIIAGLFFFFRSRSSNHQDS